MHNQPTLAKLKVDTRAIKYNLNQIKSILGNEVEVVPVIKANAYGAGSSVIAKTLLDEGVSMFGVADSKEGVELREAGINKDILLLYQPSEKEIESILKFDLTPSLSDINFARRLNEVAREKNKKVKIHIEVDTGAGRLGIKPEEALEFFKEITDLENIEIEGIFMHYASSDSDEPIKIEYSKQQTKVFNDVINELEKANIYIKYKHASCGGALLNYPDAHYNMVRPGYILYGYYPDECFRYKINLKPSLSLTSEIILIKEVPEGTPISYSSTFVTKRKSLIATIAIGYADGLKRILSNKGFVCVNNKKASIVGRVCMDITMIDVTDIPDVKVGDEVAIFDNEQIKVDDIAKLCDTIGYEIISTISDRIERVYR